VVGGGGGGGCLFYGMVQHAAVMKRIVENLSEGGQIPRIDQVHT